MSGTFSRFTAITYNAHGLPSTIVYAQGTADQASVGYTYDSNDNPATYVDELSRTTNFTYDNLGPEKVSGTNNSAFSSTGLMTARTAGCGISATTI